MFLLSALLVVGVLWCLSVAWPWYRYWRRARKLNLPIILSPTSPGSLLWRCVQYASHYRLLPDLLANLALIRLTKPNWQFREKFSIYSDYGPIFILVTPTGYELFVADRDVARDILYRRNDFPKPIHLLKPLDVFGKNIASVEGSEWKLHRKLVAKAFHEKVNEAVWTVSAEQTKAVLDNWLNGHSVQSTRTDMTTLSLNVLFKACIDVNEDIGEKPGTVESCQSNLTNFLNDITRPRRFGYRTTHKVKANVRALGASLNNIVASRLSSSTPNSQADLLSFLLDSATDIGLARGNITGNLFMVMFAGHETTASALVYMIYLLAVFPSYQDWVIEEVDRFFGEKTACDILSYSQVYPRMIRLRAILYETLRLYGPVPTLPRGTNSHDQIVRTPNKQIVVPKNTRINISVIGLHTDPDFWGPDCSEWTPSRWIDQTTTGSDQERLSRLKTDSLFAWSNGPRVCPGQKFSQVEVFAVLVHLLQRHRVEVVPRRGQDMKEAQNQAYSIIEESRVGLTLHIPRAELVNIKWIER
ncbi:cytochrome P450 monooxygenase [Aspergillus steynii IBT 23096]|uniref:Cytochrome P450 monooxygenase n=1 Tax=Aspergillus steynii IBT 23096 TaxID=1392250 RepID=A0A2I2G039_9EURO|nr:cytochrome P450 monooxygenase [Aspergillus steynii IBT 23096]PLB46243.1 cytochrome P450 monooxygenase [Aspergillus steynii IBT 23096]